MSLFDFIFHPKPPVIPATGISAERNRALHALAIAEAFCADKTIEVGGNNHGDQIEFFQHMAGINPGDPWCAAFVFDCFAKAWMWQQQGLISPEKSSHENRLIMRAHADAFSAATGFPRTGYCPTLWQAFAHKGLTVGRRDVNKFTPAPGDIVLYDFLSQGEPHHVGILVDTVGSSGEILVAEGNTSSAVYGSQADGDGCFIRPRDRDHVFGFIHWK